MVTTLTADRLAELQDEGAEFALVDTRPAESFEAWHVRDALHFPFGPEEEFDANGQLEELRDLVGDRDRIVTICAKGISSGNLATQLASATDEFEVQAVEGGMKDWSGVYDHVEIDVDGAERGRGRETPSGEQRGGEESSSRANGREASVSRERPASGDGATIVQLQRRAKGCLGYVVGCAETGEAIVVDPTEDVEEFEVAALERELTIVGVIDTHVHADHLSGGRELAERLEVPYYLGERAEERDLGFEFTPLARNEVLEVGELEVKALYTPGHTSEMITPLIDDRALLTADTLHVDSVGRTELEGEARSAPETAKGERARSASDGEDEGTKGAELLYETLHRTLLAEPEGLVVLPGHVEVTPDGEFGHGAPGEPIVTTVRDARTGIDLLSLEEDEFVERLADAGEQPANYEEIIELNRGVREEPPEDRVELELGPNNCSA